MKKQYEQTVAQQLFKNHEVITYRPEGMDFYEYKFMRDLQKYALKKMFKRCPARNLIGIIPGHVMYHVKKLK